MRRTRILLLAVTTLAALILPSGIASATTVSYRLSGTASASLFPTIEMSGTAKARTGKDSGPLERIVRPACATRHPVRCGAAVPSGCASSAHREADDEGAVQ